MNVRSSSSQPLPPHLTMDEYAELVIDTIRHIPADRIARQKEIEERILQPFRIPSTNNESAS